MCSAGAGLIPDSMSASAGRVISLAVDLLPDRAADQRIGQRSEVSRAFGHDSSGKCEDAFAHTSRFEAAERFVGLVQGEGIRKNMPQRDAAVNRELRAFGHEHWAEGP